MSRIVTVQSNFTTGEIDPKIKSRVDLQQYYNGLDVAQNVTIQPQGGIQRRNGSEFVAEIPYQNEYDLKQFNSDVQVSYVGFSGTETIGRNGIWFKPDGTKMFATIVDDDSWVYTVNNPGIVEFTMSVAWDLSTLTYNAKTSDIAGIYARSGLSFSHDGSYFFMADASFGSWTRGDLSAPWDITSYVNGGVYGSDQVLSPASISHTTGTLDYSYCLRFNADGTKLFAVFQLDGDTDVYLGAWTLSSAYDLTSTVTHLDQDINLGNESNGRLFFSFADDGGKIYLHDQVYTLSSAYDLSTATLNNASTAFDPFPVPRHRSVNLAGRIQDFYVRNDEAYTYAVYEPQLIENSLFDGFNRLYEIPATYAPKYKLVPFEFSVDDSYMLAFTNKRMFVFKNGVQVENINNTNLPFLSITPLENAYVDSLNFTQAADSLILAHPDMHPQFIQRGATDSSWTVEDLVFDFVPKYAYTLNIDEPDFTITPSDVTGNITITASAVTTDTGTAQAGTATTLTLKSATNYTSDDECNGFSLHLTGGTGSGQHRHISDYNATTKVATVYPAFTTTPDGTTQYSIKPFGEDSVDEYIVAKNGFGRARITEDVSDTEVKAFVEIPFFDTDATTSGNWELEYGYEDVWSDARGWPQSCVFHEGRLFLGGSKSRPSTVWGSRVADFFNFDPGEQLDDAALEATLDTGRFNAIVDLYSGRNLQVFTTGGEFYIPQTLGDPITPSTLSVKEQTSNGVRPGIPVVNIDGSTLFIQRQGKTLSEFLFSDSVAGYISTRISLLSSHLLKSPSSLAVRKATSTDEGDRVLIVNDDDGSIACFTLLRSEQIVAPSEWTTDGDYVEVGVDIADAYTIVKRTIDGVDRRYIERFVEGLNTDCATHDTAAASTLATLRYLEGETLDVLSDGVVEADKTATNGSITFTTAATSSYEVGLPYTSTVRTLPFEGRLPSGPTRSFKKRILSVTADLYETQALTIDGEAVTFDTNANGVITPYTGFKRKGSLLGYNKDATITITQSEPLDMNILSLDYEVSTGQ